MPFPLIVMLFHSIYSEPVKCDAIIDFIFSDITGQAKLLG